MNDESEWSWQSHASCRGLDPELFFPAEDEPAPVKAICEACPVRFSCLAFALDRGERYGIWGGLTPTERKSLDPAALQAVTARAGDEAEIHSAA